MNLQSILIIVLAILGYAVYSTHKLKNQVRCVFRRRDGTVIEKWAKAKSGRVDFDGGWYYLTPRRMSQEFYDKGIHQLLPTWIRRADFRFDSPNALDPRDFNNGWETPEARKNLNKTEDVEALAKGNQSAMVGGKKQGMLSGWMPIIMIGAFCIIGYFIYMLMGKIDQLGLAVNVLQKMLMGK